MILAPFQIEETEIQIAYSSSRVDKNRKLKQYKHK